MDPGRFWGGCGASFWNPRDAGISSGEGNGCDRSVLAGPAGRGGAAFLLLLYRKSFGSYGGKTAFAGDADQLSGTTVKKEWSV